ncbi:hypothetical protein PtA15_10A577 [Puccinia triticina]|uniref:Uncharacterized protein n=1 Tax=Puccinia triticina TaxID=208348 RepID=A0ABY7CV27_9BASI|nr:uncharacterized protein PtA15_10A577 [Puccinia triticina]WAQ89153.1 hypothetical protein PtA15_10A577 [Puccinia triticina]
MAGDGRGRPRGDGWQVPGAAAELVKSWVTNILIQPHPLFAISPDPAGRACKLTPVARGYWTRCKPSECVPQGLLEVVQQSSMAPIGPSSDTSHHPLPSNQSLLTSSTPPILHMQPKIETS